MRETLAAILILSMASVAHAQEVPGEKPAFESPTVCVIEAECLPDLAAVAKREGPSLSLVLTDGTRKVLTDRTEGCGNTEADGCVSYLLSAYRPGSGLFLVDVQRGGAGSVMAIETQDGSSFELATDPAFSPSGQRLVSTGGTGARPYDVTVWSRYMGRWIDQLRYVARDQPNESWGLPRWAGEDVVTCPVTDGAGAAKADARLTWDGQGWQMQIP